jgi:hypothetical protein
VKKWQKIMILKLLYMLAGNEDMVQLIWQVLFGHNIPIVLEMF